MSNPPSIPPAPPRRPNPGPSGAGAKRPSGARWNKVAGVFGDETMHRWMVFLDEAIRVPGTRFRFGIDGIVGLIPGAGDAIAGVLSLVIPIAAWIRGVPYVTLVRMAANIGIGVVGGAIPLLGDVFIVVWKANRRNYNLLRLHVNAPHRHTGADWAFLLLLALAMLLILALPVVVLVALLIWAARGM